MPDRMVKRDVPLSPVEKDRAVVSLLTTPPPVVPLEAAAAVGKTFFGFAPSVSALSGERDRNFLMRLSTTAGRAVLKFINPQESAAETDCQIAVLKHVGRYPGRVLTPLHIPSVVGDDVVSTEINGVMTRARAYTFLEGRAGTQVESSGALRKALGLALGSFDLALSEFNHVATQRAFLWDLMQLERLSPYAIAVRDVELRALLERFIDAFASSIGPTVSTLRKQVIHNDLSKSNFIVAQDNDGELAGILDFGDMTYAPLICDLAIAASYQMQDTNDPFEALDDVVQGFEQAIPLQAPETEHLIDLVLARTVQRLVITEWRAAQFPDNSQYILRHTSEARALLTQLFPAWRKRSRHADRTIAIST